MHPGTRPRHDLASAPAVFHPPRALGVIVGAGFTAWAVVGSILAFAVVAGAEVELKTFVGWVIGVALGLLGLVFLNWTFSVLSLAYTLD
ncbi:MAG: hypothetical protein ACRDHF_07485, partial [Tepidiformaceae bacterium]